MEYIGGFMPKIDKELKEKNASHPEPKEEKNQLLVSEKKYLNLAEQETSINLSKNLALELMNLIKEVNKNGVSPDSVNSSCNAAKQIHNILRLNFDMKKEGL